jgi:hypothetical protein
MIENGEFLVGKRHQSYLWDRLNVTSLGPYKKNAWIRFANEKLFSGVDFAKLGDDICPANYQHWLNLYYKIVAGKYPLENPLDLTINQAIYAFSKRPLWAQTFAEKRFPDGVRGQSTFVSASINYDDINHWWAEREVFTDHKGLPVFVERILTATGALQDLSVLRTTELDSPGFCYYRLERRVSRSRFQASPIQKVTIGESGPDLLRGWSQLSHHMENLISVAQS